MKFSFPHCYQIGRLGDRTNDQKLLSFVFMFTSLGNPPVSKVVV